MPSLRSLDHDLQRLGATVRTVVHLYGGFGAIQCRNVGVAFQVEPGNRILV